MTSKNRRDTGGAPIFFADQPAAMALSGAVCRVTFGVAEDDGSDFPRPVVTIAMQTVSWLTFINDMKTALSDPHFQKGAIQTLESAAKAIASGTTVDTALAIPKRAAAAKKKLPSPSH